MKTRFSVWAPSAMHRSCITKSRTAVPAQMPTLMSQEVITYTIRQRRAGTTPQGSAHQTSGVLTRPYPACLNQLRVGEPTSQEPIISLHFDREHAVIKL